MPADEYRRLLPADINAEACVTGKPLAAGGRSGATLAVIEVAGDSAPEEGAAATSAPAPLPATPAVLPPAPASSGEPSEAPAPPLPREHVRASPAVRARAKDLGIDLAAIVPAQGDRVRHADLNANLGDRPRLTLLPLLIMAICKTVPRFPMINARYDDEAGEVTRHGAVHLGIATQTDAGLMVPVIRDAQARNVWQLAREIARLAEAARSGKVSAAELSGSALTVTSLGPLGGIATTPVINRPEVAIIGPNRIVERPVFVEGTDKIRRAKLMNLSISCDHRVVDGWDAASFVQALRGLLETPVLLFAD